VASVSGLNDRHRQEARSRAVAAAILALAHAPAIHYTQSASRWQGIADTRYSARGEYPNYVDCSAFVTWCLWNGLYVPFRVRDTVNGQNWRAGYTGTMLQHGKPVQHPENMIRGDAVIYGAPAPPAATPPCTSAGAWSSPTDRRPGRSSCGGTTGATSSP
jgi:hypothetical protein